MSVRRFSLQELRQEGYNERRKKVSGHEKDIRSCLYQETEEKEEQRGGTVYDDVFRTMMDKVPHLAIPLINEVFSRQYSDFEPVTALQNEHMKITDGKVVTDSYLKIADRYYHMECQSSPDGTMAIRMIEYDFLIALQHAERTGYEYTLRYPYSCVLYLRYTEHTPDALTVHVIFPGGVTVDYQTPVIKVNRYRFEDIFQKKLLFLLPYYIMRYEDVLADIEKEEEKLQKFLEEYQRIYQELGVLCGERAISAYDFTELQHLIETIMDHVAYRQKRIREGVRNMGGKVLEFEHDILMRQSETKGEARVLVKNVEAVMRNLKLSLEKACEVMETTVGDYTKAKHLILDQKKA